MLLLYIAKRMSGSGDVEHVVGTAFALSPPTRMATVAIFIVALWCMALVTPSAHSCAVEEQEALQLQRITGYIDWPGSTFALPGSTINAPVVGVQP